MKVITVKDVDPAFIHINCYIPESEMWKDDGLFNPLVDDNGYLDVTINLHTGEIVNYTQPNTPNGATIEDIDNWKFCDGGAYEVLDENMNVLAGYEGYVPNKVLPPTDGYGDYLTLDIDYVKGVVTNLYEYEKMDFTVFEEAANE